MKKFDHCEKVGRSFCLSNQQMKFNIQAFSLNNSHFKKADEINLFLINV